MDSPSRLKNEFETAIAEILTREDLRALELLFLGRKQGKLTAILRSLATLPRDEKRRLGTEANELRRYIQGKISERSEELKDRERTSMLAREKIDITFPGRKKEVGHLHPITLIRREAETIFSGLGFSIVEGPEIETEYYNFDALNIPADHPARDLWDTFWLKGKLLLRTHTSPVQIRFMESHNPPLRIIAPGKVFRHEATDASHDFEFWQLEGLMVDTEVSVSHLKYVLRAFFQKMFGSDVSIRLRPSYFPFVEPGFEVDMTCLRCKGRGCPVCKKSGWLEVLGAGMVHQNVFEAAGYVRGEWQGFAFGVGLDRLAIMKYKIPDIRLFRQNDVRFLAQF